jgi:hypothetical protein
MRLNCFNKTLLVATAMEQQGIDGLNPRFGTGRSVSDDAFSYVEQGAVGAGLIIEKVDLGELFKGIPQDISGLTFGMPEQADLQAVDALVDGCVEESIVTLSAIDQTGAGDDLSILFFNWMRLVGLSDLTRFEVELGTSEGFLYVTARRATYYRGTVVIKYL